jgi:hypothetical protein
MEGYALRHCVGCMEQGWEGANLDNTYFPRCAVATSAHAYYAHRRHTSSANRLAYCKHTVGRAVAQTS